MSVEPDQSRRIDTRRVVVAVLALCSLGAAAIHFAVFGEHFEEYWLYGVFFAAVAWCQAIWAAWVVHRPSARLLLAGSVGNALIVAVWIVSRTVGIGIGPAVGPEAIGAADTVCAVLELAVVAGAGALLALPFRARVTGRVALSAIASAALVVAVASTAVLASPSHEHEAPHDHEVAEVHDEHQGALPHTGHGPRDFDAVRAAATPAERAGATSLIQSTDAAVARYRDVNAALADGFRPNPHQHGRLVHYPNARNRRDDNVLDPNRLEGLVYSRQDDGTMRLVAALYTATGRENPPAPGGDITMWHSHTPGCAHPAETPGCEDDVRMEMLHVWLFDGVKDPFADSFHAARF